MQAGNRIRAVALAAVGMVAFAACSTGSKVQLASAQELRIRLSTAPSTFDPGQQQWDYEAAVGRQTFEALLRPTRDFKDVAGAAADSYKVDSTGKVYTFRLHPGARWSDGKMVKAADFVYAFQRLLDPRLAAPFASFYYTIQNAATVNGMDIKDPGIDAALQTLGLKAVDDNTFEVTLEAPAGYFKWVASLSTSAPVRKDVVEKWGKDSAGGDKWAAVSPSASQQVVGNGLFKVFEVVILDHVTLVPNTGYAGSQAQPSLTKITEYFIDNETDAYAKYKSGQLDMITVPMAESEAVRSSGELLKVPQLSVFWINLNVRKAPFDNPKVRLAVAQAIDRESYKTNVRRGRGLAASTLIPKGMRNYRPDLGTPQKFDAATARATLASSGASAASLNGVRYTYISSSPSSKTTADFVQAQLKANLGVDVALDGIDYKTYTNRLRSGNYAFGGPTPWGADYPDSQDFYDIFMTGSGNQFSGWSNKAYDDAVTAADAATDQAKRDAGYESAEKTLISDVPVIFMYQPTAWYVVKPYVRGIITTPNDDQWLGSFFTWSIQIAQH
ncbi:MAG TPA: peptide ABC transporter substrate-binding protein [Candidatus Dormibacteraeota bacterium]|nr:peptide ABC transporter substrate-binding protein [Candidatus Dormibacteraeota bacterium]